MATVVSLLNQDIVRLFKSGIRPNSWTIVRCYQWTTNRWAIDVASDSAVFQGRFALVHRRSALYTTIKPRKKSKEFLIGFHLPWHNRNRDKLFKTLWEKYYSGFAVARIDGDILIKHFYMATRPIQRCVYLCYTTLNIIRRLFTNELWKRSIGSNNSPACLSKNWCPSHAVSDTTVLSDPQVNINNKYSQPIRYH